MMNFAMMDVMHKMDLDKNKNKSLNLGLTMLDKMIINSILDMDQNRKVLERYNENLNT